MVKSHWQFNFSSKFFGSSFTSSLLFGFDKKYLSSVWLVFGHLLCGNNNCEKKSGGFWDAEDDCCEQPCSSTRPCVEGSGPCQQDSDCAQSWMVCSATCLDRAVFPAAKFPNNSITMGFDGSEKCCHRRCHKAKEEMICEVNQVGCRADPDCKPGLFCDLSITVQNSGKW